MTPATNAPSTASKGESSSSGTLNSSTSSTPSTADLAGRLRLSSTRLVRRLRQESATGLPLSALSALAVIDVRGPMSLGTLAEIEGVTPPTVTRIAKRLEADGLVERTTDVDDKRIKYVTTTPSGAALLARSRERRNAWLADRLARLDEKDLAAIERVVELMEDFTEPVR